MSARTRSFAALWTILAIGAALLTAVAPVAAKEGGAQAQLTTTIPRDATPGSTLLVEWNAFMPSPVRRDPILGSPIFIRLLPAGAGKAVETRGFEEPSLSGHYVAKVRVPESGIGGVQIGLLGEICEAGKACVRDDIILLLVGPVMSTAADPAAAKVVAKAVAASAAPAPAATAAPAAVATAAPPVTTPAPTGATSGVEPGWLAASAVMVLAVIGLLAVVRLIRRRGGPSSALGSGATRT